MLAPILLATIACASGAGHGPAPQRMGKDRTDTSAGAAAAGCRGALKALGEGRLAGWIGLRDCTEADADAALGAGQPGPALANAWGRARHHPAVPPPRTV